MIARKCSKNALIDFDGTLLFVSHDRYFINRLATKVLEITEKGSTLYLGDYDYYLEKKAELEELARLAAGEDVEETVEASATDYQLQKANQKERRRLARRYEEIEARLETIEERIGAIQEDMHACNDTIQLMTWQEEWDQLDQEQQLLMEEWESIAEQIES